VAACPSCKRPFFVGVPTSPKPEQAKAVIGHTTPTASPAAETLAYEEVGGFTNGGLIELAPEPSEAWGGMLGRFRLMAELGQGSFGIVYKATDPLLDREVAIKVPKFADIDPLQSSRFLGEAKAAARLKHPNIVTVFETGQADGQLYIVSEFVDGQSLLARLKQGPISPRQAAAWTRDLALGLAYAHDEGVIHRDVKPANIMIARGNRAQLMDFGLAKRLSEVAAGAAGKQPANSGLEQTLDGVILGTPAYMSPEQARGEVQAIGPKSDQYGLGVVLYEMLTGRPPFEGPGDVAMGMVKRVAPKRPTAIQKDVPPDLEAICLRAMSKLPDNRYPSMAAFAADLSRFLADEPVDARPATPLEQLVRQCRKNRWIAVLAAVSVVSLFLAVASMTAFVAQLSPGDGEPVPVDPRQADAPPNPANVPPLAPPAEPQGIAPGPALPGQDPASPTPSSEMTLPAPVLPPDGSDANQ
jgi:serine/threonine protein kinase